MRGMMRKGGVVNRTALGAAALLAGVVIMIAGCNKKTEELTGNIQLAGSTSMEEMCVAIGETFMEEEPGIAVSAEYIGSTAGMEALLEGTVDIGTSSRNLTQEELEKGAVENIVARDGIAVILNKEVTGIENLTSDELRDIFCGRTANWNELGGPDMPVVVTGHEAGSGTRGAFEEILKLEDACKYANELDSTGAVMAKVASTPGAIGYVSLDVIDDTVKLLTLNGVEANEENIKTGDYFLSRPFVMATNGEISAQNDLVKALFDYVYSAEGDELVKSVGLITTK